MKKKMWLSAVLLVLLLMVLAPFAGAEELTPCDHKNAAPMQEFRDCWLISKTFRDNPGGCEYTEVRKVYYSCEDCGTSFSLDVSRDFLDEQHYPGDEGKCVICGTAYECIHPLDQLKIEGSAETAFYTALSEQTHILHKIYTDPSKVTCTVCRKDVTSQFGKTIEIVGAPEWHQYGFETACNACGYVRSGQTGSCSHQRMVYTDAETPFGKIHNDQYCKKYYVRSAASYLNEILPDGTRVTDTVDFCADCLTPFKNGKALDSTRVEFYSMYQREVSYAEDPTLHEYENGSCLWCGYSSADAACSHKNTLKSRYEVKPGSLPDETVCGYYVNYQIDTYCVDCGELLSGRQETGKEFVSHPFHEHGGNGRCKYCGVVIKNCDHPYSAFEMLEPEPQSLTYWAFTEQYHYYTESIIYHKVRCKDCGQLARTYYNYSAQTLQPHNFVGGTCIDCDYTYDFTLPDCSHTRLLKPGESTERYAERSGKYGCKKFEVTNDCWALVGGKQVPCDFCLDCRYLVYQGSTVIDGCANLIPGKGYDGEFTDHEYVNGVCYYCSFIEITGECPHQSLAFDHEVLGYIYTENPIGCQRYARLKRAIYCSDCSTDILTWTDNGPEEILVGQHSASGSSKCRNCGYNVSNCKHPQESLLLGLRLKESERFDSLNEHTHRRTRVCSESDIYCEFCDTDLTEKWKGIVTVTEDLPHNYENGVCTDCGHTASQSLPECSHERLVTTERSVLLGDKLDDNFCAVRYVISNSYTYVDGVKTPCDYCLDCGYAVYQGKIAIDGKAVLTNGAFNGDATRHAFENKVCIYCGAKQNPVAPTGIESRKPIVRSAAATQIRPSP